MVEQVPPVVEVAIYFYCLLVGTVGISLHCWIQIARRRSHSLEDTRRHGIARLLSFVPGANSIGRPAFVRVRSRITFDRRE